MSRQDYAHLYKTKRWKTLRAMQLKKQPMCECPHCQGKNLIANVVDHIDPHKGDRAKFFNPLNLRSMDKSCHDKFKQSQERGGAGFKQGSDAMGRSLDPSDPWFDYKRAEHARQQKKEGW